MMERSLSLWAFALVAAALSIEAWGDSRESISPAVCATSRDGSHVFLFHEGRGTLFLLAAAVPSQVWQLEMTAPKAVIVTSTGTVAVMHMLPIGPRELSKTACSIVREGAIVASIPLREFLLDPGVVPTRRSWLDTAELSIDQSYVDILTADGVRHQISLGRGAIAASQVPIARSVNGRYQLHSARAGSVMFCVRAWGLRPMWLSRSPVLAACVANSGRVFQAREWPVRTWPVRADDPRMVILRSWDLEGASDEATAQDLLRMGPTRGPRLPLGSRARGSTCTRSFAMLIEGGASEQGWYVLGIDETWYYAFDSASGRFESVLHLKSGEAD